MGRLTKRASNNQSGSAISTTSTHIYQGIGFESHVSRPLKALPVTQPQPVCHNKGERVTNAPARSTAKEIVKRVVESRLTLGVQTKGFLIGTSRPPPRVSVHRSASPEAVTPRAVSESQSTPQKERAPSVIKRTGNFHGNQAGRDCPTTHWVNSEGL